MEKYGPHERASLGMRQSIGDVECATTHLELAQYSSTGLGEEIDTKMRDIRKQLVAVKEQLEQCQSLIYKHWSASLPGLCS